MKGATVPLPTPPQSFTQKKARILQSLAVPDAEYTDASPKGSVDEGIRELIGLVNGVEGLVTTSSCAGRVSVFREGSKKGSGVVEVGEGEGEEEVRKLAGVGGKGGGGSWLFVSHGPVPLVDGDAGDVEVLLGLKKRSAGEEDKPAQGERGDGDVRDVAAARLVHFKFEPMILHVLTASPEHAQLILRCGLQAGFRESGAVSLTAASEEQPATPIVAIRSMGLAFESLIGYQSGNNNDDATIECTVSPGYLRTLIRIANDRFKENSKRIQRFQAALAEATKPSDKSEDGWEDAQARRERKRAEGLRRRAELQGQKNGDGDGGGGEVATEDEGLYNMPTLNANLT